MHTHQDYETYIEKWLTTYISFVNELVKLVNEITQILC